MPKITELNAVTSVSNNDLLIVIRDPTGLPTTDKITVNNFINSVSSLIIADGAVGYTGSAGVAGTNGIDGFTGSTGSIGYTGSAGTGGAGNLPLNGNNGDVLLTGADGNTFWYKNPDVKSIRSVYDITSYNATANDSVFLVVPSTPRQDILITFPGNAPVGKVYSVRNIDSADGQFAVVVRTTDISGLIEDTLNSTFTTEYRLNRTGDTETWIFDGTYYRNLSSITSSPVFLGSGNTFHQVVVQNKTTSMNASGDFVVYNDQGNYNTGTGPFIDMGIDSSDYYSTAYGLIFGPNDGYVYTGNANLLLGTSTQGTDIKLFTGNTNPENLKLTISDSLFPSIQANAGIMIQQSGGMAPPAVYGNSALATLAVNYDAPSNTSFTGGMISYPNAAQLTVYAANDIYSSSYAASLYIVNTTAGVFETNVLIAAGAGIISSGDIVPDSNNVFGLGNTTNQWKHLYVGSNTIYMGGIPLRIDTDNNLSVNGNIILNKAGTQSAINSSVLELVQTMDDKISNRVYAITQKIADTYFVGGNADEVYTLNDTVIEGGNANTESLDSINAGFSNSISVFNNSTAGTAGLQGSAGPNGYTGSSGALGYTGSFGLLGYTGSAGSMANLGNLVITGNEIYTLSNTGNVAIESSNGTSIFAWTFDTNGNLTAPGNSSIVFVSQPQIGHAPIVAQLSDLKDGPDSNLWVDLPNQAPFTSIQSGWVITATGNAPQTISYTQVVDLGGGNLTYRVGGFNGFYQTADYPLTFNDPTYTPGVPSTASISSSDGTKLYTWTFNQDGTLVLPGNTVQLVSSPNNIIIASDPGYQTGVYIDSTTPGSELAEIYSNNIVNISSSNKTWTFGVDGTLKFPDNHIQNTAFNTTFPYTWSNVQTFNSNVSFVAINANNSLGSSGQVLTSNGNGGLYWSTKGDVWNVPAVSNINLDATNSNVLTLATNETVSFSTFSGEILVNDLYNGYMYKFLVGGGRVWLIGSTNPNWTPTASAPSNIYTIVNWIKIEYTGSYVFTNLAASRNYNFVAIKTRNST
jgi:hypothetical protein